jgi:RNA polymerase sigma factor (sigma-70 family)
MSDVSDAQLLRDYAEHGQEAAFREIVARHTDAIYSAALRQVGSHDLACDVAQSVFTDLARKAASLSRTLEANASLLGWLYRSTRFAASNQLREDRRRQVRERLAMEHFGPDSDAASAPAPEWERIGPVLDAAMADLSHDDCEALLLRFFQNHDFRAIGQSLGVSDDTAQKRVSRALEKLRAHLTRRGVTTSAAALSLAFSAHAVQGAPAGLAAVLSNTALAGATLGTTATVATTITMTTLQKTFIAATLAVAVGTGVYEAHRASVSQSEVQTLQQQQALLAQQIQQLTRERDAASSNLTTLRSDQERVRRDIDELPKLRGELTRLRALAQGQSGTTQGNAASAGSEDSFTQSVLALTRRAGELNQQLQRMPDKKIPELAFLNESDWLSVAKDANLQTEADIRQSLANLRNAAKGKFGNYASHALDKYLEANNQQLPADLSQLKPYFDPPVDDAVLQRYQVEVLKGDAGSDPRDNWVLIEKAPADKDYEMPLHIRGWTGHGG